MDPLARHHCGVLGVFGAENAASMVHQGLIALQHRGQESAGIAVSGPDDILTCVRGEGLVVSALDVVQIAKMVGTVALGHVRYSTSGGPDVRNAQPLMVSYRGGQVAVAHNGDLTNKDALRREGQAAGATFFTSGDTEVVLNLLGRTGGKDFVEDLHGALRRLEGAFSMGFLRPGELHAVRDPNGFRPLSLGRRDGLWIVTSETCALSLFDAEHVRDLDPGEHVIINKDGVRSLRFAERARSAQCVFEHVYFARPDSRLFGQNVHQVRVRLGELLAERYPANADLVTAVPESGNSSAQGFSRQSGLPLDRGFVKNHYLGRTFIQPTPALRESAVRVKLSVVPEVVKGKRVVVVDDSIIRGTTTIGRMRALRAAGVKEIHLRISSPPTRWPCFFGIDFPTRSELVAAHRSEDEIRDYLGVDSLGYLATEDLMSAVTGGSDAFCTACFTGDYPAPIPDGTHLDGAQFSPRVVR